MKKRELSKILDQLEAKRAPENKPLTERQQEILEFVRAHIERFGFPPTRNEIANALGLWPNGVQQHLVLIMNKGHIRLIHSARGIVLT